MIYDYITKNFNKGEPIFLNEIPDSSKEVIRQEMKRLTDEGKLERSFNGVYYIPYKTILGTDGKMSIDKYIEKKYFTVGGYLTGISLVNKYGFTSQNPSVYEICSNGATTKQRKLEIDGNNLIIYKPVSLITKDNIKELEFLSLMSIIDKYSELSGIEYRNKLREYVDNVGINFNVVREYISLFPTVVYKNIYEGGLMNELV